MAYLRGGGAFIRKRMPKIKKQDIEDVDFFDAKELSTSVNAIYRTSKLAFTRNNGVIKLTNSERIDLANVEKEFQIGDLVHVVDNDAAGFYTISEIINDIKFKVAEPIVNSKRGLINFLHPSWASLIGINGGALNCSKSFNLEGVIFDLDKEVDKSKKLISFEVNNENDLNNLTLSDNDIYKVAYQKDEKKKKFYY